MFKLDPELAKDTADKTLAAVDSWFALCGPNGQAHQLIVYAQGLVDNPILFSAGINLINETVEHFAKKPLPPA
jgi:hypothetical protein